MGKRNDEQYYIWQIIVFNDQKPVTVVQRIAYSYLLDWLIKSLSPGRFQINFRQTIFKLVLVNGDWGIAYEIDPEINSTRPYWW